MDYEFLKYTNKQIEEIFNILQTSERGLTEKEAQKRLKIYGPNKVKYFKIDLIEIIKRNTFNYFNILLFIAGVLAFTINGFSIETILIFTFLFLAIFIAVYQDYKSNKLAEELLGYFKIYAKVKRENKFKIINSEELTVGDYIRVETGNLIPADIRVIKSEEAIVDESIITGESEPVFKNSEPCDAKNVYEAKNIGFSGTILKNGYLEGIVIAVGEKNYIGKIAKSTIEISKETAYQKTFNKFAQYISFFALFLVIVLLIFNFFKPSPIPLKEFIIFSIALAISIVPEFLPGIVILNLSISALSLAKRGLVVKRLSSIEDLGGINILCTDKTGTLTKNEMELLDIKTDNLDKLLKYGFIDYLKLKEEDPYIFVLKNKFQEKLNDLEKNVNEIEILEIFPFEPKERVKKIKIKELGKEKTIIRGAPENVISFLKNTQKFETYLKEFKEYSKKGYRTLSVGILENNDFEYLGLLIFEDPLKESAKNAMEKAKKINLTIKMITGDAPEVAEKVGIELGLCNEGEVITGDELEKLGREELIKVCEKYNVFARILPEQKFKIVNILQEKYSVGFLGEGINDAQALKIADVSLVVDTASDITKEESDVILKEKNLELIVDAVYEGRKSVFNIGKYLKHTMSDNFGNFFSIAFLSLILKYVPLTPVQILLTNFITDFPLIFVAYDNVKNEDIKKPVSVGSFEFIMLLILLGSVAAFVNITTYLLVKDLPESYVRTAIFIMTTLTGITVMFSIRTKDWLIFAPKIPFIVFITLFLAIFFTIISVINPLLIKIFDFKILSLEVYIKILILLTIFIILTDIAKKIFYSMFPDSI